jgi:hypothetical protein
MITRPYSISTQRHGLIIALASIAKIVIRMYGLGNISKPLPYTSNAFKLFLTDVLLFIHLSITWPIWAGLLSIVLPFHPSPSGALDELAFTWENLQADVVHTILFIAQILFLISLVVLLCMGIPTAVYFGWIGAFIAGNMLFCKWLLNGPPTQKFFAGKKYAKDADATAGEDWVSKDPAHEGEKWVFINGVAVG